MEDNAKRTNLLTYIGTPATGAAPERMTPASSGEIGIDEALWQVVAAHAVELRRSEVIDDTGFAAVARSLSAVHVDIAPTSTNARDSLDRLDSRIESQIPPSVSGAATLGLAREEWLATANRLLWRDAAIRIAAAALDVSESVQVLAETHVVTIMPAYIGGRPAQPTTLAHYLGGVIGPLASARLRLQAGFAQVNRSPMGAGMLAGDVLAADREDLATRLGFDSTVANTFDAVSSVEDVVAVLDATASIIQPVGRFVRELGIWIRTDPTSFVLDEGWDGIPEPAHPSLVYSARLEALERALAGVTDDIDSLRRQLRRIGYGPLGMANDDAIANMGSVVGRIESVLSESRVLFATGLVVNRAYLGNRAGRGYTTAGDLATFLMTEEQIPPTAARRIAVLVLARLKDSGLEVSGITPDMIDSAALLTIGREIKVEMETLGRFLAPRRYIERRQVTGSPATEFTRAWLINERDRLLQDRRWLEATRSEVERAIAALESTIDSAAGDESEG